MRPLKKCPSCGGNLARSRTRRTQTIAGREFVLSVAADSCRRCRAVFLENRSLERADVTIGCEIARHGPISGEAFRYLRKVLGLQAIAVAVLLEVTPETISRWENGQRPVDKAALLMLGSVVLEHAGRPVATLARLRELRPGGPLPNPLRVDATSPRGAGRAGLRRSRGA